MSACRPTLDESGRQEFNFQLPDAGLNSYTIQASLGRPGCSSSFWSSQVLHQSVPRCSPAAAVSTAHLPTPDLDLAAETWALQPVHWPERTGLYGSCRPRPRDVRHVTWHRQCRLFVHLASSRETTLISDTRIGIEPACTSSAVMQIRKIHSRLRRSAAFVGLL